MAGFAAALLEMASVLNPTVKGALQSKVKDKNNSFHTDSMY